MKSVQKKEALKQVAAQLGVSIKYLSYILYGLSKDKKYISFQIPKKKGGVRLIKSPVKELRLIQARLSKILYQRMDEIEKQEKRGAVSFAFKKGNSIVDNAKKHKGRRWILNLDLQDFFPSFNFGRVRGFFIKDKNFQLREDVATIIAQIACDGKALPQGSPCSPIISELIARILDIRLLRLAKKYKLTYTRYADDITFSTNREEFPEAMARQDSDNPSVWTLGSELVKRIENSGFRINNDKTRMSHRNSRQTVTGLVVNKKVNILDEYYRQARAMCHSLFQEGFYYRKNDVKGRSKIEALNVLAGRLNFIYHVKDKSDLRSNEEKREVDTAIRKLYKSFLFYEYFIALDKPLIITEGKTDPIYLKEAVKSLPKFQPSLGKKEGKRFYHAIRYFNYHRLAHELLGLYGGGTSNLKSIPLMYKSFFYSKRSGTSEKFKHRPMKYPVIIFLDNDNGLGVFACAIKKITESIKKIADVKFNIDTEDDFYYVMGNLYVVKTQGKESYIEKFFPEHLLNVKIDGKTFCPENKNVEKARKGNNNEKKVQTEGRFDNTKYYGKEIFAQKIIKNQAKPEDFNAFTPLLKRIESVIEDYKKRQNSQRNKP